MPVIRPDFSLNVTTIEVDAMYYHAAKSSYAQAVQQMAEVKKAEVVFQKLEEEEAEIFARHGGDAKNAYDELESVFISMESAHVEIGMAHAPLLRHLAITQILCAACLEAHVNLKASDRLSGHLHKHFEQFPLNAKWIFLPKLLGLPGFDPGAQPFQGFAKLVKCRNELVHYKPRSEEWRYGQVPAAVEKLGLTLDAASGSLDVVPSMIQSLADQLNVEAPDWLRVQEISYFTFDIVEPKQGPQ